MEDNTFCDLDGFLKLTSDPEIIQIENNGCSWKHVGYTWYTLTLSNCTEIQVYLKGLY